MNRKGNSSLVNTERVIQIIRIINKDKNTTAKKMADEIGISIPTIRRTIKRAREILGVDIKYSHSPMVDDPGWYEIKNYGVLNSSALGEKPVSS